MSDVIRASNPDLPPPPKADLAFADLENGKPDILAWNAKSMAMYAKHAYQLGLVRGRASGETYDGPTPHHVRYDRSGWLCSVCGGWNDMDVVCQHPHAPKANSATDGETR